MKSFFIIKLLLLFSFLINTTFAADKIKVTFFDVGQGNCTLIKTPKFPPLLVDAGSTGFRNVENFKLVKISKIKRKIVESLLPNRAKRSSFDLYILVSHGDIDHYGWIKDLKLTSIIPPIKIKFLLGGEKENYTQLFSTYLSNLPKSFSKVLYSFTSKQKEIGSFFPKGVNGLQVNILSPLIDQKDTNASSLVLKVLYGSHSVILTGDATGKTTDHIIAEGLKKRKNGLDLTTTILQASHHGACTEKSNNEKWLVKTSPQYVVFSAGERLDYHHPHFPTLQNILKSPSLKKDDPYHDLQYFSKESPDRPYEDSYLKTYLRTEEGYSVSATSYGVYNTTNQGDITFSWDIKDHSVAPPAQKQPMHCTLDCTYVARGVAKIDRGKINCLYFSCLKISSEQNINEILLSNSYDYLTFLSVDIENDVRKKIWSNFCSFVQKHATIRDLDLSRMALEDEEKQAIQVVWNHRGLIFQ